MKKFILKIILFLVIISAIDYLCGFGFKYLAERAQGGQSYKNYEVSKIAAPDVLILGSSRAIHHYVPQILEDSLNKTVYNAGYDGNGIVLMYPLMRLIAERHKPEIIIYDIHPIFDIEENDNSQYTRYLKPLYGENEIVDSVIIATDNSEKIKLLSSLYMNNSNALSLLKGAFDNEPKYEQGYYPLYRVLTKEDYNIIKDAVAGNTKGQSFTHSKLKESLLEELIAYCKANKIKLYFVLSPFYGASYETELFYEFVKGKDVQVLDYINQNRLNFPIEYFADPDHLNHYGAEVFTKDLAREINNRIREESTEEVHGR